MAKRRAGLTDDQRTELLHWHPFFGPGGGFGDDKQAREQAWEAHRDALMAEWATLERPGTRPAGWWWYDAPQERNKDLHETLQLAHLRLLAAEERAELEADHWPLYERQARERAKVAGYTGGDVELAYRAYRREYGIPDDFVAPRPALLSTRRA